MSEKEKQTKDEQLKAKEDAKYAKLEAKYDKAYDLKDELNAKIDELKTEILNEPNQAKKDKLRAKRDQLVAQRNAIVITPDEVKIPMQPKTKKIIKAAIAVVVILALLLTYIATGACRNGLLAQFGIPQKIVTAYTITDADGDKHSVKVSTYNYYFAMYYNNLQSTISTYEQYGIDLEQANMNVDFDEKLSKQTRTTDGQDQTWLEYIDDQVQEGIKDTYTYYYMAVKANDGTEPEITEDQQTELDETLEKYKSTAEGYGYTLSGYLEAAMGKGVTEEVFRKEAKISYISQNYQEQLNDEMSNKEYSEEDLENYKNENIQDLQSVDVKMFECDNEDDAIAFASELKANGSNFADLASKYSSDDWDIEANKDTAQTLYKDITYASMKKMSTAFCKADADDSTKYSNLEWLFSTDRTAGEVKQVSTSVVYIVKPVNLSEQKTVNVRHILIKPESDDEDSSSSSSAKDCTEEQWSAAYEKAVSVLDDFNNTDKTETDFASLAQTNSSDSNASEGGLYENVVPNQMVATFNAWCFDSSRSEGDTAIVKTQYGYHIMYFVGYGQYTVWQYTAQQALASADSEEQTQKIEENVTIKKKWFGSRFFQIDTDIDS